LRHELPIRFLAQSTALGRLLHMGTGSIPRAARAILSLTPLDSFVDKPALRMEVAGRQERNIIG
jgi:L-fucose mutarotase